MNFLSQRLFESWRDGWFMGEIWYCYWTIHYNRYCCTNNGCQQFHNTVAASLSTVTSTASNHSSNQTVDSCFKLTPYWGNLVRPLDDPDYPWLGLWTSLLASIHYISVVLLH